MVGSYSPDVFSELLPVYYKRLFPYEPFYRWLSYGPDNTNTFANREMSFTLPGDVYIRYQSFDTIKDFEQEVQKKCPEKIDIGAVYNAKPKHNRMVSCFEVEEKELVFDIDMTDYDKVRTCCSGADICIKCWHLITIATTIIDTALRDDFGFEHRLWVFSGRRGVHCWVCDQTARVLTPNQRAHVAEYLQVLQNEDSNCKTARIPPEKMHPSIRRAVDIIAKDFVEVCVKGQNILGSVTGMKTVLKMLGDDSLRQLTEAAWEALPTDSQTSVDRWNALVAVLDKQQSNLKRWQRYLLEEIMLHFAYPRLDIEVSKGANHLLKSPFCVHPKTGKVCVPFNPLASRKFDPTAVPTLSDLIEEIQKFDAEKVKAGEEMYRKIKDYKKTSMYKGMQIFEEFLRNLEESWKSKKVKEEGMKIIFYLGSQNYNRSNIHAFHNFFFQKWSFRKGVRCRFSLES
ncbi:hypothetical protein AAG570_010819 [Ranatra chinensis]|uniref:DNA primase n=1 Tax=Ranatra chinensis TaxID=642074 RepID=A0ABD0YIT1_9HEMI